jgi:hypothetical protein
MRYMLLQQFYAISRPKSNLAADREWTLDDPRALTQLMGDLAAYGQQIGEDKILYRSCGIVARDRYGVFCTTEWVTSPIQAAALECDLRRRLTRTSREVEVEGDDTHFALSSSGEAPSDYIYQEFYEPDTVTWEGLFDHDGRPRPAWDRLIIPFLLVRRLLISSTAFCPEAPAALELAKSFRGSRVQNLVDSEDDSALVWIPNRQRAMVVVTIGDLYPFGRLTAISLAETALCLITAARFVGDTGIDLTLANPIQAFRDFYANPNDILVEMADGRSLSASELLTEIGAFLAEGLAKATGVPGMPEILLTLRGSLHWLDTLQRQQEN